MRRLHGAIEGLKWASEGDERGVILLSPSGRVEFASWSARRHVRDYFGGWDGRRLPLALVEWLGSGSATLVRRCDDRCLTLLRSGTALLLEETREEPQLTPREREILGWVALGKTNAEIAELLWIAPTTVRKHLENVFAKLGVSTRTAAAAVLLGAPRSPRSAST